jgi:hypothetical protein
MKKRRVDGISSVEIACGLIFLVVISLLVIDVAILFFGYEFNDQACRDACSEAAKQTSPEAAQIAAFSSLKSHKADGNFVADPVLLTGAGDFKYQNFAVSGGNASVTITTECRVKTPVPLTFVGSLLGQESSREAAWTFRKRHTLPIATYKANAQ